MNDGSCDFALGRNIPVIIRLPYPHLIHNLLLSVTPLTGIPFDLPLPLHILCRIYVEREVKAFAEFCQIARAHSGCDIEINLPPAYASLDERVSLIAQLAALPVDDLLPRILAEGPVP